MDVDFHEDFPPLPKSVKPTPSPTLKKLAEAASPKDSKDDNDQENIPIASDPIALPTMDNLLRTPTQFSVTRVDAEMNEIPPRPSVQGTPALPRAPPPSSAELSTAGNTAPSTPNAMYSRPRFSLHDHLVHANASLATLQDGHRLVIPRSALSSPLLGPSIVFGEFGRKWNDGDAERMGSLDTTIGIAAIPEMKVREDWIGSSLVRTS
jgi:hypothetical protein